MYLQQVKVPGCFLKYLNKPQRQNNTKIQSCDKMMNSCWVAFQRYTSQILGNESKVSSYTQSVKHKSTPYVAESFFRVSNSLWHCDQGHLHSLTTETYMSDFHIYITANSTHTKVCYAVDYLVTGFSCERSSSWCCLKRYFNTYLSDTIVLPVFPLDDVPAKSISSAF